MDIIEIIKEGFVFPSTDLTKLAIYIALSIVTVILIFLGFAVMGVGIIDNALFTVLGIIVIICGIIVGFILSGYLVSIVKSGIDQTESAPEFNWKGNLITGIKCLVMSIVYYIIPAIIVLIVGWATNLFGMSYDMMTKMMIASMNAPANTTVLITDLFPQSAFIQLGNAMIITGIVAIVLFIFFALLQTIAQARLANTDSLGYSLNIVEAFKDIGRIGWGKVIAVVILLLIIIIVINAIINVLNIYIPGISILSIVVTPYLVFFSSRAVGLLYSDIA